MLPLLLLIPQEVQSVLLQAVVVVVPTLYLITPPYPAFHETSPNSVMGKGVSSQECHVDVELPTCEMLSYDHVFPHASLRCGLPYILCVVIGKVRWQISVKVTLHNCFRLMKEKQHAQTVYLSFPSSVQCSIPIRECQTQVLVLLPFGTAWHDPSSRHLITAM